MCVCVCVFTSCDLKISINNLKIFKPNLYFIRFAHSSTWSTCNRLHVWEGCLLCWHVLQKCKLLLCFSWFQGWRAAFVWGCSLFCKNIIVIWKDILLVWNTFISPTLCKNVLHFINGKMYAQDYHSRTGGSCRTTIWIFTLFCSTLKPNIPTGVWTYISVICMCSHSPRIYLISGWVGLFYPD